MWAIRSIHQKNVNTESLLTFLATIITNVHLDKAKIATLARLNASSDDTKCDRSRRMNTERNTVYYHAKNSKIWVTCQATKIVHMHQVSSATTRRKEKIRRFLEDKLGASFVDWQARKTTQKNAHIHLCVALRIGRNQSACVI